MIEIKTAQESAESPAIIVTDIPSGSRLSVSLRRPSLTPLSSVW